MDGDTAILGLIALVVLGGVLREQLRRVALLEEMVERNYRAFLEEQRRRNQLLEAAAARHERIDTAFRVAAGIPTPGQAPARPTPR